MITRVLIRGRGRQKRKNQRDSIVMNIQFNVAGFVDEGMGL